MIVLKDSFKGFLKINRKKIGEQPTTKVAFAVAEALVHLCGHALCVFLCIPLFDVL